MMSRRMILLGLFLFLAGPGTGAGQEPEGVQRVQQADSTATFDFQGADLRVVISALAEVAGLNIVYGDLPSRTVTLRTSRPVALADVRGLLENVARGNGLELVEENGLLRVVSVAAPAEAERAEPRPGARREVGALRDRRLYVYRLRHAPAETIVQTLRALFGLEGGLFDSDLQGDLSLSEVLRDQRDAAYRDVENLRAGTPPAGRQAAVARGQGEGTAVGLQGAVDIVPDPLSNAILILAVPADYEVLQDAIEQLDARPLQVMIEVLIAEVRRTDIRDLGIDIDIPLREGDEDGATFRLQGLSAGDVALSFLGIGDVDATVILRALASKGDVTILSRPLILAQNNKEARVLVGDQRPFIQVFRALPTDAAVRDQVVQYRSVGTSLVIRPTINSDGYVNLVVQQEVSTATAEVQFGAPVINTREAETELLVRDGHTVILGGLIDSQVQTSHSGIPLLKDIPGLGLLFRSTQHQVIHTELFLLLTPHVISSDEEMDETTRKLRESTEGLQKRLPDPIPLFQLRDSVPDSIPLPEISDTVPAAVPPPAGRDTIPR